jgi:acyl carrier protein
MTTEVRYDRQTITDDVLAILQDMTSDWDTGFSGAIGPETRLVADLAFESIDVVQLIVALEERYQRRDLPFEELLMAGGRYVDEIRVSEAVQFLHRHLNPDGAGA